MPGVNQFALMVGDNHGDLSQRSPVKSIICR
jgi:hypothetical protein